MNDKHKAADDDEIPDDPPPVFGAWPRLYRAVLIYLAALIGVFYLFQRMAAP
jgi:hypothetical protein